MITIPYSSYFKDMFILHVSFYPRAILWSYIELPTLYNTNIIVFSLRYREVK